MKKIMAGKKQTNAIDWTKIYQIAALIVLIAPISIVFSYIYNFGYFYQFDIGLSQIPISWNDFLLTSIRWFPIIVIVTFSYIVIEFYFKRIEGYSSEQELTENSPKMKKFRDSEKYWLPLVIIMSILYFLAKGHYFTYHFTIMFTFSCLLFNLWLVNHTNYSQRTSLFTKIFVPVFTILMAFFFSVGRDIAHNDYLNKTLALKTSTGTPTSYVIRTFEKCILIHNPNGDLEFVPIGSNITIYSTIRYSPFRGYLDVLEKIAEKKEG